MPTQGSGSAHADILLTPPPSTFTEAGPYIPVLFKISEEIQEKNCPDSLPIQSSEPKWTAYHPLPWL